MARSFQEGKIIESPLVRRKQGRGILERIGGFVAPTTTGLITGEKKPSPRTIVGAGLEIGSFAIPATAVARGAGIAGRILGTVARGAKAARAVPKTAPTATVQSILGRGAEAGRKLGTQAKRAAQVGGVSGALFGAGRALGEEEKKLTEVAGEAALGGILGGVGGAVLGPTISLATGAVKGTSRLISRAFRGAQKRINPQNRAVAVQDMSDAVLESMVEDRAGTLNKLEKIANRSRRFGEGRLDEKTLVREMVEEGFFPKVEGETARFGDQIADAWERVGILSKGVDEVAQNFTQKTSITSLKKKARESLLKRTDVDLIRAEGQLNRIFKSLEKQHGKSLTPQTVNKIRMTMNRQTKGDPFVTDVSREVGNAMRNRLDEFSPDIRRLNSESQRLIRVIDTMDTLRNRKINVGFLAQGAGRFLGTVGASAGGFQIAGPGGLVVAGLAAQLGARGIANIIRQSRFDAVTREIIKKGLRNDQKLLSEILKKASPVDSALIKRAVGASTQRSPEKTPIPTKSKAIKSKLNISSIVAQGERKSNIKKEIEKRARKRK